MKLLLSHIADPDGITPIILLNLLKEEFEYKLFEANNISRFIIEKIDEDTFKLTFKKGIYSEVPIQTFSIRISNSGSRYEPFNTVFMSMYKKLKEYDFNNHQIHIEEYLYNKKKIKQRSR